MFKNFLEYILGIDRRMILFCLFKQGKYKDNYLRYIIEKFLKIKDKEKIFKIVRDKR